MEETLIVVKKLESYALSLIKKLQDAREELHKINTDKIKLQEQIKTLHEQLSILKTENEQLKTTNALLGSKSYKRETKLKINRLIKEVDHCIVQLSE